MELPAGQVIPVRTAATGRFSVSVLSVAVPEPGGVGGTDTRVGVSLLRRARALGVTGFDLSRSSAPLAAARRLRDAFPDGDTGAVTFVALPAPLAGASRRTGTGARTDPVEGLLALHDALGPDRPIVVILDPGTSPETEATLMRQREDGEILDLVRPLDLSAPGGAPVGTELRSAVLSLLNPGAARWLTGLPPETAPLLVAFDPFADGALDGTRLERAPVELGPQSPPSTLRDLESTFAPVLRLGFLTRPGRPLFRAALDFVVGWPSVLTTVVPLPPPERLDSVLAVGSSDPFSPEELARLGIQSAPSPRGSYTHGAFDRPC